MDEWLYAAVVRNDDGSQSIIGTCAVAAGAAAFAVSCGHPRARVVKVPATLGDLLASIILEKCVELTDEDAKAIGGACERALMA